MFSVLRARNCILALNGGEAGHKKRAWTCHKTELRTGLIPLSNFNHHWRQRTFDSEIKDRCYYSTQPVYEGLHFIGVSN
jgi:hypothetical protein